MNLPEIDTLVFFFINKNLQNSIFDIFFPFITKNAYIIFLPLFFLFFLRDRKKALIVFFLSFLSLLGADWISNTLKYSFERLRPCNELDGVRILVGCGNSFSMPSNHATNAFAFAVPFYFFYKNSIRYAFLVGALLVGISRIYVGVHYPSDVIVGAIVGSSFAISSVFIYRLLFSNFKENRYKNLLFLFLFFISLLRIYYIQSGPLDLSPDETHYWEWSRRLDLSYYSKGPLIAYLVYIGTLIFGNNVFGIRIMAVIFSALSSIIFYIFGKNLYDEKVGLFSAILVQIIPLFSTYGIIFTIDSPLIFFWSLSMLLFWKAIRYKNSLRDKYIPSPVHQNLIWLILGATIGLGLLTKYTMAFFYLCAFLFLLFTKDLRRYLSTKGPYIALITSLIVFSPVIIWNSNHNWVTLKHTAGQVHLSEGFNLSIKSFIEFIGSQFGVITPLMLILMGIAIWKMRESLEGSFLFWLSVPVIVFFTLKSFQAKVQANWALPGYLTGITAFSSYYMQDFKKNIKKTKILVLLSILISLLVTSIAHYPSILNLPIKMDPSARLRGWKELGKEVSKIYEEMSINRPVFIFSDRYQISSELAFYVKGNPVTYCINLGRRMNQYDLWPGFHDLINHDAIFVRKGNTPIPENISNSFSKVEKRLFKTYTKNHIKIREYSIFLCYDFKGLKKKEPIKY